MVLASGKESACQCRKYKRHGFGPWVRKIPWTREWKPTPVFLPGKFHIQMSLTGYSPWGHQESDMTERISTHKNIMWPVVSVQRMKTITAIIIFVQNSTPINFSNALLKAQDTLVH